MYNQLASYHDLLLSICLESAAIMSTFWPFLLLTLPALFIAACSLPLSAARDAAREASLYATIDALSTENALLVSKGGTSVPNNPAPEATATPWPERGGVSRLPRMIAAVQLVAEGHTLRDMRLDAANKRIYVTDSQFRLHVLDSVTYERRQIIQTTGDMLLLDEAGDRLYIMPSYDVYFTGPAVISIFDIRTQSLLERTLLGGRVSVDSERNYIYVGDLFSQNAGAPRAPLRLLDGVTFEELARSERVGAPLYNPARKELILTAYSAYTLDPQSLAVREDLFPEISGQEIVGCNGCETIRATYYFPDENLLAFERVTLSAGKGPGVYPPPYYKLATTLRSVEPAERFALTCSSQPILRLPWHGRIYDHIFYSRYVTFNNLVVSDLAGAPVAFRDGLDKPFVNPGPEVAYINDASAGAFVLDLESLLPLAYLSPLCLIERTANAGLLFAFGDAGSSLLVLEESGGAPEYTPPRPVDLNGAAIRAIYVSPDYTHDQTAFLDVGERLGAYTTASALYRSTDGGRTWVSLTGGGLPAGVDLTYSVALSPDFGRDHTLLVGGFRRDFAGIGIWRSTDTGETWQAAWGGLDYLRINQVALSPNFSKDRVAVAYARFQQIEPWASGAALYQSEDGGQSWMLKTTANDPNVLPPLDVVLPGALAKPALPLRKQSFSEPIEYTGDNGSSWQAAVGNPGVNMFLVAFQAAPFWPQIPIVYAVLEAGVLRSLDGGRTWQSWQDPRLVNRTYDNFISAAAVTPLLADGTYRLLIGTLNGEFWQLDPAQLLWTPLIAPAPQATPAPAPPTATPQPAGLVGDPPLGFHRPQGLFNDRWERDLALQAALGWTRSLGPWQTTATVQPFENGLMFWRGDTAQVYVVFNDLTWQIYGDSYIEGDPDSDANITPPAGLLQPRRGFGKVWRDNPDVREKIGWALGAEKSVAANLQEFERGLMIYLEGEMISLMDSSQGKTWK